MVYLGSKNKLAKEILPILKDRRPGQYYGLQGVVLMVKSYRELIIPPEAIIYCDPPYEGTTGYSNKSAFNHSDFWQWCRDKSDEGHTVFISEYNAPDDFICVWSKEHYTRANKDNNKDPRTEKLFTYL